MGTYQARVRILHDRRELVGEALGFANDLSNEEFQPSILHSSTAKPGIQLEEKEFPYFSLNLVSVRTLSAFEDVYIYPLRKRFIFHDCCGDPRPPSAEV